MPPSSSRLLQAGLAAAVILVMAACAPDPGPSAPTASATPSADTAAVPDSLATTINVSALDHSPREGAWGCCVIDERVVNDVVAGGFTAVRLPARFSAHQASEPPYAIEEAFLDRVEAVVGAFRARGLTVIVDNHHWGVEGRGDFDLLFTDPPSQRDRLMALWRQVAERFADADEGVVFEILNEPHGALDAYWDEYQAEALGVIRESNPDRWVVVSPGGWGSAYALDDLELPDDPRLIATFHHYLPFDFTHQGAPWVSPIPPVGATWPGPGGPASGWESWSWDTSLTWQEDGVAAVFTEPWAGLALHSAQPVPGATEVTFTVDRDVRLRVHCAPGGDDADSPAVVDARAGQAVRAAVADCSDGRVGPGGEELQNVWLQIEQEVPGPLVVEGLTVRTSTGPLRLTADAMDVVRAPIDLAEAFGEEHGVPVFLGEFGSHNLADHASRVAWTRAVRDYAVSRGVGTAYWGLYGSFGLIDPGPGAYDEELLDAATSTPAFASDPGSR